MLPRSKLWLASPLLLPTLVCQAQPIALQLATVYQQQSPALYLISEKYDGVRGYWDGQQLWTRQGHLIQAPASFIQSFPPQPLDGELWLGYHRFNEMAALLERHDPTDPLWNQVHYLIFDLPAALIPFQQRYQELQQLFQKLPQPTPLKLISQNPLLTQSQLQQQLHRVTHKGGEGLVLHLKTGFYQPGRSGHLLKLKPMNDAEAKVIGYRPGQGKYAGEVGALQVQLTDGTTFAIGSGLTDQLRAQPPAIGSWITFAYNGLTAHGKPRFARYLRPYHAL
ncbi:DNA ligase [Celerinatantimonas sp. YJH-8]|uniref:DNA ligase n=1 Tax=Celerinatantimonas sp. YJH-8 TaxID=3228714 RepID=UPI0038C62C4A